MCGFVKWVREVQEYLHGHGDPQNPAKAMFVFQDLSYLRQEQRHFVGRDGQIVYASGPVGDYVQVLSKRLDNLRRIADRMEDHF
jgi:hypothetical protein